MAITFESLVSTLDQMNLSHFPDPAHDATLVPFPTPEGIVLVLMRVECDGTYLAFHSHMPCPGPAPDARLGTLIAEQNFSARLIQFGAKDGTISARTGIWLCDTRVTEEQLKHYLGNFVMATSIAFAEVRAAANGRGAYHSALGSSGRAA